MALEVSLSPEIEAKVRERAAASGKDVAAYVVEAVEEKLNSPASFAELLAPIHAATRKAGLSEHELDTLIEQGRDEVFSSKRNEKKA